MRRFEAFYSKKILFFRFPAQTSRDTLHQKVVYYLYVRDKITGNTGIGECSYIPGLSIDPLHNYETTLGELCHIIQHSDSTEESPLLIKDYPSIAFGYETAMLDLKQGGKRILYDTDFTKGKSNIPINGLIWMDTIGKMKEAVEEKVRKGFNCIKIKVGGNNFTDEIELLKHIREAYKDEKIVLRLDANGAFSTTEALEKLKQLSEYNIHSIEQPIRQGNYEEMARLCELSPIPIALDEELIGLEYVPEKARLLDTIKPQYLILKPSLIGGCQSAEMWIKLAEERNIQWWATSALESNIGLNAIAQWVSKYKTTLHQGLGTGQIYSNNTDSPLEVIKGHLHFNTRIGWGA